MFIEICGEKPLAPEERHLSVADAAPPELKPVLAICSINIALLRS